jgi:hypothetical protein
LAALTADQEGRETLEYGHMLNEHRVHTLGFKPSVLLCTRRTEAYGMSSTTLRKCIARFLVTPGASDCHSMVVHTETMVDVRLAWSRHLAD